MKRDNVGEQKYSLHSGPVSVHFSGTIDTQQMIAEECDIVKSVLLQKNREYGDSALNPRRIFSTADSVEQLNVRIDDKLSRIMCGGVKTINEDTDLDLIGYLILRRVAKKYNQAKLEQGGDADCEQCEGGRECHCSH